MGSEILFFTVLILFLFFSKKRKNSLAHDITDPLYVSWMLMSISIFDYTPSVLQYGIRAGAMVFSIVAILQTNKTLYLLKKGAMGTLLIYISVCAFSTFWSVDMIQTFVKVCEILVDVMLISAIVIKEGIDKALYKLLYVLMRMSIVVEIYIALGSVFMHSSFITFSRGILGVQLTGGIVSANTVGGISVFIICCLLNIQYIKYKPAIMILAITELFLSQARTSIVSLLIMFVFYLFQTRHKVLYAITAVIACAILYYYWDLVILYLLRGTDITNMQTMSGRTTMWDYAKVYIQKRPLLGYGFGSGGEMVSTLNNGMTSLHSGIYECLMGVGYTGLSILLLTYILVIKRLIRKVFKYGMRNNTLEIMLLSDLTIRTYMSTGGGGWHSHVLMIWFVLVTAFSIQQTGTLTMLFRNMNVFNIETSVEY